MVRGSFLLLIALLLVPAFASASEFVLVSIQPFYDVVREIGKGLFRTEVLIPGEADYHLYELTPEDMKKIARAEIIFVSGIPVGGWERKIESVAPHKVFSLTEGMSILKYKGAPAEPDPHVWLSPKRMLGVAENAFKRLVVIKKESEKILRKNYSHLRKKLLDLNRKYSEILSRCRFRVIPTVHPALGYLARDYGLRQIALGQGHAHGGIYPKSLERFIKELRQSRVDFIIEPVGIRSKVSQLLKEEYGIKIYKVNVKLIPTKKGEDYFTIMESNLKVFEEALGCNQ